MTRVPTDERALHHRIAAALAGASDTRHLVIGSGVVERTAELFRTAFGNAQPIVVADPNTFRVAGRAVLDTLRTAGLRGPEPLVFERSDLYADMLRVQMIEAVLQGTKAIPVAVGSGTINDLVKLAAHRCGRRYMVVATAASMDGYTAYGASISERGSKQTFFCPAPLAVVADLEVLCAAPADMNAAGYADLVAKVTAGADWLVADALGAEPINAGGWDLVQKHLRQWAADPSGVRSGRREAIVGLVEGLLMTGFAMQHCRSSRPASGAEHQFSHLWDMQHHLHAGQIPWHGFKVGIGTLAVSLLYEQLLDGLLDGLDVPAAVAKAREFEAVEAEIRRLHAQPELLEVALAESRAKHLSPSEVPTLLERLRAGWPALKGRLSAQLINSGQMRDMLKAAGAPSRPVEIGIDLPRLRKSYIQARHIRRRFTVLDLVELAGLTDTCVGQLFAIGGPWALMSRPNGGSV